MRSAPLRFWVIAQELWNDVALKAFDTKLEAEYHQANLEHEYPNRYYKIERLRLI